MERNSKSILTHSGAFHADDIFAVATMVLYLENTYDDRGGIDIIIVRSRDPEKIRAADFVLDVGGIYDPAAGRFDHHQIGRAGERANGVPYAAFGLVWKEYGHSLTNDQRAADHIDKKLVVSIDAQDNGMQIATAVVEGVYQYTLNDIAKAFRTTTEEGEDELDTQFLYLVNFAKELIKREMIKIKDKIKGSQKIQEVYETVEDKRVLILDKAYNFSLSMLNIPDTFLLIFPDDISSNYLIDTIKKSEGSFDARMNFPQSWAGKRDQELEEASGVSGAIFCHTERYFAVAATRDAAIKMAHIALKDSGV